MSILPDWTRQSVARLENLRAWWCHECVTTSDRESCSVLRPSLVFKIIWHSGDQHLVHNELNLCILLNSEISSGIMTLNDLHIHHHNHYYQDSNIFIIIIMFDWQYGVIKRYRANHQKTIMQSFTEHLSCVAVFIPLKYSPIYTLIQSNKLVTFKMKTNSDKVLYSYQPLQRLQSLMFFNSHCSGCSPDVFQQPLQRLQPWCFSTAHMHITQLMVRSHFQGPCTDFSTYGRYVRFREMPVWKPQGYHRIILTASLRSPSNFEISYEASEGLAWTS